MDPFTPPRRASDQPYKKIKFKSTYTPLTHPSQTPGYSSSTWATPQHHSDILPDFASPGILPPCTQVKFKSHLTPQIHPHPTSSYSSNTWATPEDLDGMLPTFASPGKGTPHTPFAEFAAPWVPSGPAALPILTPAGRPASNSPRKSTKRTRRDSNTENVVPSSGASAPVSKLTRMKELDNEIQHASTELARLQDEREELRETLGARKYTPRQKISEKLEKALQFLDHTCKWSLSAFLWNLSQQKAENGDGYHRGHRHAEAMARFLQ